MTSKAFDQETCLEKFFNVVGIGECIGNVSEIGIN